MSTSLRASWLGFTAMCIGLFMAILDIQIVAAALSRIARDLHTPLDELSWVQTTYLIAEIVAIAMSGRLARAASTRWLFTIASLGFACTSLGCALSTSFASLIVWRSLQGLFAGLVTPTVFAAGYKMFPKHLKARAVLLAGAVAMLAPSIGPWLGGYVAQSLSWNWIFLINVPIGLAVAAVVAATVHVDEVDVGAWRSIDLVSFIALSAGLAALQILLKVAPGDSWSSLRDFALVTVTVGAGVLFVRRCLRSDDPLVDLAPLREGSFAVASVLNFVLGTALYGSLYLLPLFLGFVRFHTALEIGTIMTVMGASQLAAAPLATLADKRLTPRIVAAIGFGMFALGALGNAFQTPTTDFAGLFVPQALRGAALLFCILPITAIALDPLPLESLSNASSLLNFMRNIGGAVGIGFVDTIVNLRPPAIAHQLLNDLVHGKAATAAFVGIPRDLLLGVDPAHADAADIAFVRPIIARASATIAFNEAWLLLAGLLTLGLVLTPWLSRLPDAPALALDSTPEKLAHDVPSLLA